MAAAACIAALMAAAACGVVALCFTAYTLLLMIVPPAGAGAIVFGLAALIALIAALIAYASVKLPKGRPLPRNAPPPSLADQALDIARGHPIATVGIGLAAGLAAFANPALVTAVLRAFTAPPRNRP
jgi:hypothetical protein